MNEELREELRSLPGVADAEVDGDDRAPASVRVRLHPEADPQAVGLDIQRVLASHGMRSRIAAEEAPAAAVVSLPVVEGVVPPRPEAPPPLPTEPSPPPAAPIETEVTLAPPTRPAEAPPAPPAAPEFGSIAVEESAAGVVVTATGVDGRRYTRSTTASEDSVAEAVVAVVAALGGGPVPRLLSVSSTDIEGSTAVTVVLEGAGGRRVAGAAIVAAGHAFAVGRATWSALHG